MRRALAALPILLLLPAPTLRAQVVTRAAGEFQLSVDTSLAFPGGLIAVRLSSRRGLPALAFAVLDGRRCPFFAEGRDWRALVPVAATDPAGVRTLGIDLRSRRGRRLVPFTVEVPARAYPARTVPLPELKRPLLAEPGVVRDSRRVQLLLRTESPLRRWIGPFRPPVDAPPVFSYGAPTAYPGAAAVETLTDCIYGEVHRGMDYPVPAGTVVQSPAAGVVLMASTLPVTGQTLVLDHGQGVLSVFFHLGRLDVAEGQLVEGRFPIGVSGDSGIAAEPHVHWAVYVHGVAVDPRVLERLRE
ncbi:MAG TPA: M23 family metallopeptidase [Vicinamibacteria bacterium]|jgi:murein DD-endopeptidase MepM/ murein hydrolase activator NlpD